MSINPVTRARLIGSAAIVITTVGAIAGAATSIGPSGLTWAWIIGGVALSYAAITFVLSLLNPKATDAAWDEQNMAAHQNSLVFGFWAVLAVFLIFLVLSLADRMDPGLAFYWLGPVLGAMPSAHYLTSVMRGRAE